MATFISNGEPITQVSPQYNIPLVSNNGVLKASPNLVEFNETRISNTTWPTANKTKGFEVNADVYNKSVGDQLFTNANCFGVFVPAKINESVSLDFFDYSPDYTRCYYCEVTADGKCNTAPVSFASGGAISQQTFTLTQADSIGFVFEWYISAQQTRNYTKENYMIVRGTTPPTTYIPYGEIYTDGTVETIQATGKNLLNPTITSGTFGRIQVTVNDDKTITLNGSTSTDVVAITVGYYTFKPNTTYRLVGSPAGGNISTTFGMDVWVTPERKASDSGNGTTFTVSEETTASVRILIRKNYVCDNMVFKPMITYDTTATYNDYEQYYDGGTATAEMLLKVGDYQDVQSIIDGVVTRNVGVMVLDGSEAWGSFAAGGGGYYLRVNDAASQAYGSGLCSHFPTLSTGQTTQGIRFGAANNVIYIYGVLQQFPTGADWFQYLADQYAAGTPVIVLYPLATPTTESVAGQTLQVQAGNNTLEITQASLDNLELEAKYQKSA